MLSLCRHGDGLSYGILKQVQDDGYVCFILKPLLLPLINPGKLYSKEQATQLKQAFWTAFGQYLKPQLSADGLRTNWVNYKTGIKHLYFKMEADKKSAFIAIEMSHPDADIQQLMFDQFVELKNVLSSQLDEEWEWELHTTDEYGKTVSRIIKTLPHVSVFKQEDWPALISFFKPRIIALDEFWSVAQYSFDLFR